MEKAEENLELITRYFSGFTTVQIEQLMALDGLYKEWNSRINVISRKDEGSLYEKHILHSLSIAAAFEFKDGADVLDLGTGGGFPGIPLAIYFPQVNFFLADSIGKKIRVVQAVSDALGLKNVTAQHLRAEEISNRKFDTVVSRAVAPLGELWKWSRRLIKADGQMPNGLICLKGGDLTQEIAESGVVPHTIRISDIFREPAFRDKYILYVRV